MFNNGLREYRSRKSTKEIFEVQLAVETFPRSGFPHYNIITHLKENLCPPPGVSQHVRYLAHMPTFIYTIGVSQHVRYLACIPTFIYTIGVSQHVRYLARIPTFIYTIGVSQHVRYLARIPTFIYTIGVSQHVRYLARIPTYGPGI
jgi:ribose/xylose/arabinose/galactoside ABC-type transport system permease subunit